MIELVLPNAGNREAINTQVAWLNNRELMRYSEQRHRHHSYDSQLKYIQDFLNNPSNILREIHREGILIGTITAYTDTKNRIADVGILIGAGWGGKGYGYQAWAKFCDILFKAARVRRIEAGCMADNLAMARICQKYGMQEEGRRPGHFMLDGAYSDLILYGRGG